MVTDRRPVDSTGRRRYHGSGKRGGQGIVRVAVGSLTQAIASLTRARDEHELVDQHKAPERLLAAKMIAQARAHAVLGIKLARAALDGGLPTKRPSKVPARQMKLALRAAR